PHSMRATLLLAVLCGGCADPKPESQDLAAPPALATAPDVYFESAPGVRLRFRQAGRGEPVVLLHGFAASLAAVAPLADSLAMDHRVVALDQRGHGRSTIPSESDAYGREMGSDVVQLLDHLEIERAHLVGHSMGAVVSAFVASRYPDRVATVSMIAPPFFADSAAASAELAPVVAELAAGGGFHAFFERFAPEMPDSMVEGVNAAMLADHDRAMLIGVMQTLPELSIGRAGASVARVPAVIVTGLVDTLRVEDRALAGWWPDARFVEVAGADHVSVFGHPATIAAIRARIDTSQQRR